MQIWQKEMLAGSRVKSERVRGSATVVVQSVAVPSSPAESRTFAKRPSLICNPRRAERRAGRAMGRKEGIVAIGMTKKMSAPLLSHYYYTVLLWASTEEKERKEKKGQVSPM